MVKYDFNDKSVMITGGGGDLGSAVAGSFYADGASIILIDISMEAMEAAADQYGFSPERSLLLKVDVTDEEQFKAAVDAAVDKFGKIDVFFNNAGKQGKFAPVEEISVDDFRSCLELNVVGVLIGLKCVLPVMYRQGYGSVINTASQAGVRVMAGGASYSVSKAATMKLSAAAAIEAGPKGVRVNTLCPGMLRSRMMENAINHKWGGDENAMIRNSGIPLGRLGELDEIAASVKFLASDDAGYVSGLDFIINGASTAR